MCTSLWGLIQDLFHQGNRLNCAGWSWLVWESWGHEEGRWLGLLWAGEFKVVRSGSGTSARSCLHSWAAWGGSGLFRPGQVAPLGCCRFTQDKGNLFPQLCLDAELATGLPALEQFRIDCLWTCLLNTDIVFLYSYKSIITIICCYISHCTHN